MCFNPLWKNMQPSNWIILQFEIGVKIQKKYLKHHLENLLLSIESWLFNKDS